MATRNDIILRAFKLTGEYSTGETPAAADMADAVTALEDTIAELATEDLHLWQQELITITPVAGQTSYTIGTSGTPDKNTTRPLRVHQAFIRSAIGNDTTLVPLSRQEYMELASKSAAGRPNQFYYQPTLPNGTLYLYPTPKIVTESIILDCHIPFDQPVGAGSEVDFPSEWSRLLSFALALDLGIIFSIPDSQYVKIQAGYNRAYENVTAFDAENASVFFSPAFRKQK